jgi:MFS superfamily sulfate permease-like transporter
MVYKRKANYFRMLLLKHDLPAGLSVFLVALPLCLGIALASGAPLYAGLISGMVGGIVVSLISRSPLSVSGPAAGLTTVVAAGIISFGDYRIFLLSVILAGVFQVLLGVFKLGSIANYFPSAVIRGMLAAIGIMLISKQIPLALGFDKPDFWRNGLMELIDVNALTIHFSEMNNHTIRVAILISLASISLLIFFQRPFARKLKMIPAPLLVVLVGVLINELYSSVDAFGTLRTAPLVNIPHNIFQQIQFPDFSKLFAGVAIYKQALLIGLLASLETLLCVEAIDKLDKLNRITPVNRELVAQGVGNIVCGMVGGLPITAVIVRGAANIDAGGRTQLSSFSHGVFLLIATLTFPFLINKIPYASLAAILLVTGYNLTRPRLYIQLWKQGFIQFLPFIITIISILFTDLLIGVSIGLLISAFFVIHNNLKSEFKVQHETKHITDVYLIKLSTHVTFLNKVKLRTALEKVPKYSVLTVDGSDCEFMDQDVKEMLTEYITRAKIRHIEVHLKNIATTEVAAMH